MKLGFSDFVKNQILFGNSSFVGSDMYTLDSLLVDVYLNWVSRKPGVGRDDLSKVVSVPIFNFPSDAFKTSWIYIDDVNDRSFTSEVKQRQPGEDSYLSTTGVGPVLENRFVNVILYSADTLLENNGERSGDFDWEVVAIIASPWEHEPMMPLTMARNFLEKPGGTFAEYTAQQFAESIYHWSQFIKHT